MEKRIVQYGTAKAAITLISCLCSTLTGIDHSPDIRSPAPLDAVFHQENYDKVGQVSKSLFNIDRHILDMYIVITD
ncbi:hypothetical protein [Paenibacillus lutimineralis]|uniref:hypothetical protein n=1 Tax=Paenibacillus lutimineralis TaxID=2707005 RepID=UPI0013A663DD|nr:hypothetical protein [Paenibacillus lutimineralis]